MDVNFIMGSMGMIVGEKIICLFEWVIEKYLLVVIFIVFGGVCM